MQGKQSTQYGMAPIRRRSHIVTPMRAIALSIVALLALLHTPWSLPRLVLPSHCHHSEPPTVSYAGEHISWQPCGQLGSRPLECSNVTVPMDHFNATNSGNKTFLIPLLRLRGLNGTQNILLNPGGPGGSGLSFMYRKGELLRKIIGEGFHLLAFDPRGVNQSVPGADCFPPGKTRSAHPLIHKGQRLADAPEIYAWTANFARACADSTGEHGQYINTPQTAADMNSIIDAVGQRGLYYWGFSYGTLLGQTYAAMFPARSERVVIDGVGSMSDWYGALADKESLVDTQRVMDGFFDECVAARPGKCALAEAGKGGKDLKDRVMGFADQLADQPLAVYINTTHHGYITAETLLYDAIFPSLYRPASWPELATNLAGLLSGNNTSVFFLAYDAHDWAVGDANAVILANDARTGPANYPDPSRDATVESLEPWLESTPFAHTEIPDAFLRAAWSIPTTHTFVAPSLSNKITTAHPLLVISTSLDPVCPLVSARGAAAVFAGSRIVEVEGYGHCSVAVPSVCLGRRVRAYFNEGLLPENEHVKCGVDEPYFPGEATGRGYVAVVGEEEREMYEGLIGLAREWEW